MEAVIAIENLRKQWGEFVLDIPRLDIAKGYITGFVGENGAGKTTTLRLIMDAIRPQQGHITVLGDSVVRNPQGVKRSIGYVDNQTCFVGAFKICEVRRLIAPFYPDWEDALFYSYCDRFGLRQEDKVKSLSTGKSKLLSLAVALSHRPRLLIMDEPTSGLDPVVRSEMLDLFAGLMDSGETSILYSTHITSDLDKTADYIVFIHRGKILLHEEKDRLLSRHCLVKGDNQLLPEAKHILTGIRSTSLGFTALCGDRQAAQRLLGDRAILETPNIEALMIHMAEEEHHA